MDSIVCHQNRILLADNVNKGTICMFSSLVDNTSNLLHQVISPINFNPKPDIGMHPIPEKWKLRPHLIVVSDNGNNFLLVLIPNLVGAINQQLILHSHQGT